MTDTSLGPLTDLHFRVWGEFHTMPGLRVTADQICRLMGSPRAEVVEALKSLVDSGVLCQIGPYYMRADIGRYTA